MKYLRLFLLSLVFGFLVVGDGMAKGHSSGKSSGGTVHVKGYTKKNGTYVAPHTRTAPNGTKNDNWSTKGNVNPYTGKAGTKPGDGESSSQGYYDSSVSNTSQRSTGEGAPQTSLPASRDALMEPSLAKSGRTKAQVLQEMGEPNIRTETRWLYSGKGIVEFTKEGKTK